MSQPQTRKTIVYILATALAAAGAFFGFGALGAHLNSNDAKPGANACKASLVKQYEDAANGKQSKQRPAACIGVSDARVKKYIGEIMEDELGKQINDGMGSATPQP